ncbi:MAG: beta-lactamase family protein [Deltaproteobacteria bacterium]|nr:beta-lactamase family protein [Deltaproteobacteria bacterium]
MRTALFVVLLAACGGGKPPAQRPELGPTGGGDPPVKAPDANKPPEAGKQLDADTIVEAAGAKLAVPKSWFIGQTPEILVVRDPEHELTLGFVAGKAATYKDAMARAWKLASPGFALEVAHEADLPARDGWDQIAQAVYVTKAEDRRVALALARRKGETWYVVTVDGLAGAIDRRGAQLNAIVLDMKVPGVAEESFDGRPAALDAAHLAKFDALAEEARKAAGVPGAAIAVVHKGKVVFEKGYGVQSLGAKKPVTPKTMFMIGSTTKSLTTLMLARLVDAGKLTWDTPVTRLVPSWKLADADTTAKATVRHTVCACTGMPRQDLEFIFEYDGWDPERRVASMAAMKPTTGFGETFQYSNLMVAMGGWAGGQAYAPGKRLGPAYDQAMQALVFDPLGMKSTTFDPAVAIRGEHATPHARSIDGPYEEIPVNYERITVAVRPAGAAWSTVRDLAQFAMLELAHGKRDGKTLVGEANLLERRKPQVRLDDNHAYGLGLFVAIEHGTGIVSHAGNTLGFTSDLFLLPDHDTGVVLLTNGGGANELRSAIQRAFLETVFEGKARAMDDLTAALAREAKSISEGKTRLSPADPAWLDPLLGPYDNADLGRVSLRKKGTGYEVDVGEWRSAVAKYTGQDGTVSVVTTQPPFAGLPLVPRTQDGKQVLILDAGQHQYVFVRAAK